MSNLCRWFWLPIWLTFVSPTMAQHHHGGTMMGAASHGHGGPSGQPGMIGRNAGFSGVNTGFSGGFVGGGFIGTGYFGGNFLLAPQQGIVGVAPVGPLIQPMMFMPGQMGQGGLMMPMPPQALQVALNNNGGLPATRVRRASPSRARELVLIASRSFRANDVHRAAERLQMAIKADPANPSPHLHMAQVSIVRGDYKAAAESLRMAVTVANNREWLLNAPDIQAIYSEPADFAKQLAKLESHLQANPNDRDAWFVLGAQWYFSGRTQQAADVFQRLTDRRPDEALAAFLDASTPERRDAR